MFDAIRNHKRWLMFLLLLLVFPSFVFFGVQNYSGFMEGDNALAKVGRQTISPNELEAAMSQRTEQLRQMFGGQVDPKMFDTPEARKAMLDQLINQKVLAAETSRSGVAPTDAKLQETISAIPDLQQDGKFDYERYKNLLAARGMNERLFEANLRADLASQRLTNSIAESAFLPTTVVDQLLRANEQAVDVQEQLFKPADFTAQVKPTPEALKTYYEANKQSFEIPETIAAEYVALTSDAVGKTLTISDAEIKTYYEQNQARFGSEEQRQARHILIAAAKDAKQADQAAAKAKAEALLAQVKKDPASFVKLAKENSQDPGSAPNGGDLGFFGRGAMVKPFEDAAFALKPDEISGVVQSDFGFHIIQLVAVKPAAVKPLEQARPEIESQLRKDRQAKEFAKASETFSNTVYEQGDSLAPAAEKFKLPVQKAEGLTRARINAPAQPGEALNGKVVQALFKPDAIESRKNIEAVEAAPGVLVAARVTDHKPARVPPFEEVQAQVSARYIAAESARLATETGKKQLAQAQQAAANTQGFGNVKQVSRANPQGVSANALREITRAVATSKLPAVVGVELEGGAGYALYRVAALSAAPAIDEAKRTASSASFARSTSALELQGVLSQLRDQHKAKVLRTDLRPVQEEGAPAGSSPAPKS
jgi:peptidyl-prolyl cis-trans isomerase D